MIDLLSRYAMVGQAEVFSFAPEVVRRAKELCPGLIVGICYQIASADPVQLARSIGADVLHPWWHTVSIDLVGAAHRAGLRVVAWTVNEPPLAEKLVAMGADALATDCPAYLRARFLNS